MKSINVALEALKIASKHLMPKIEVNLDLYQQMPEIYGDDITEIDNPIWQALVQLMGEIRKNSHGSKALYETRLKHGLQKVMLYHNGRQLPQEALVKINSDLERIASGVPWTERRHGNQLAAERVRLYGGRVYIENLSEGQYTVRTTLELKAQPLEQTLQ